MSNLMKHRWFELRHQPVFILTIVICYAFSFFLVGMVGEHYMTDSPMVAGVTQDWMGLFMNSTADMIFPLLIIGGTFTSMILGQQFTTRTVNLEIAAGHSRKNVFASQSIIGFAVINITVLPAIIIGSLFWVGRVPMPLAAVVFPYLIRVIVLLSLLNSSLFSACILFMVLFRDTAKTMAVSALFLFFVCFAVPMFEESLAKAPGTLYPISPTLPLYLNPAFLVRYVLYSTLTPAQGILSAVIAIGWSAVFLGAAYCIFRRCELK